jgi:hypothetical protein
VLQFEFLFLEKKLDLLSLLKAFSSKKINIGQFHLLFEKEPGFLCNKRGKDLIAKGNP